CLFILGQQLGQRRFIVLGGFDRLGLGGHHAGKLARRRRRFRDFLFHGLGLDCLFILGQQFGQRRFIVLDGFDRLGLGGHDPGKLARRRFRDFLFHGLGLDCLFILGQQLGQRRFIVLDGFDRLGLGGHHAGKLARRRRRFRDFLFHWLGLDCFFSLGQQRGQRRIVGDGRGHFGLLLHGGGRLFRRGSRFSGFGLGQHLGRFRFKGFRQRRGQLS